VLLVLVLGSIWLAIACFAYLLAVAAAVGDAALEPAPRHPAATLSVCPSCLSVIERRREGEACPACNDGMVAAPARSAFAHIPS
jgi:hypothetical protein